MKKSLPITAALLYAAGMTSAFANDDCTVPLADWVPRSAVQAMAKEKGWNVERIKTDSGCYEVKGYDAKGRRIKVKLDPKTLAVVKLKYQVNHRRARNPQETSGDTNTLTDVTGTVQHSPVSGLFGPGTRPNGQVE